MYDHGSKHGKILEVNRIPTSGSLYNRFGLCYFQAWGSPFVPRVPGYLKTLIIHLQSISLYMYLKKSLTFIKGMYRMLIPAYR